MKTNTQLADELKNIIAYENRMGEKLFNTARDAGCTMANFSAANERHPAVIRWCQAVGRGCSLRLEAQVRLQRAQVVATADHHVIEALMRLPSPAPVAIEIDRIAGPVALLDYADAHADDEITAEDVRAAWSEMTL